MELHAVAQVFDTCPVYDGYSGSYLFKAQTSTFLESSSEGSTSARRVLSLAPDIIPPTHSVVLILNQLTLLGYSNSDEWAGTEIRKAYWSKRVTDDFKILSPAQVVLGLIGQAAFGQKAYLKDTVNGVNNSDYDPQWNIFVSASLPLIKGSYLQSGTTLYRVRSSYLDIDGFRTATADEVESVVASVTFTTASTYDPITDSFTPSTTSAPCLVFDIYKDYTYQSEADPRNLAGDLALILAKSSITPKVGDNFTYAAQTWRVLALVSEQDAWKLHIRKT